MKNLSIISIVFSLLLLIVPTVILISDNNMKSQDTQTMCSISSDFSEPDSFKMLDTNTGQVIDIPAEDYITGAVCAQIPPTFEDEAIKAQAVIAHTYIINKHLKEQAEPDPTLKGADFSNDTSIYDPYYTKEQIQKLYSDSYDKNILRINKLVSEVKKDIICYNNAPIIPAFHSISTKITESAHNVWGKDIPYLKSVETYTDESTTSLIKDTSISAEELKARLTTSDSSLKFNEDTKEWIKNIKKTSAGTVLSLEISGKIVSGSDLCNILSLSSERFEITLKDNTFIFSYTGIGHGVGLSQYGALKMAKEKSSYKEILAHYYTDTNIITIK